VQINEGRLDLEKAMLKAQARDSKDFMDDDATQGEEAPYIVLATSRETSIYLWLFIIDFFRITFVFKR
jgi:hypothetical protein